MSTLSGLLPILSLMGQVEQQQPPDPEPAAEPAFTAYV